MSHKFFLSNPSGDGFETFATIEERDAAAQKAIDDWLIDGTWHEDVFSITVGEVTGEAVKANIVQRPAELDENGEDEDGNYWDVDEKHDVEIRPIATDIIPRSEVAAALRELRAKLYSQLFWHDGTYQKAMAELDATITALGLAAEATEEAK